MENPIFKEIRAFAPDYVLTDEQKANAERAEDPQLVASRIYARVKDAREDAARYLKIPIALITIEEVLASIPDLNNAYKGAGGDDKGQARRLGLRTLIAIGARTAPKQKSLVEMCFEGILNRLSDSGGFEHYQDRYEAGGKGNTPLDIVRDIQLSPEGQKIWAGLDAK